MAGLRYEAVRKEFGEVLALRDLDLEARDGELLVLLGPSGSGKTTALRIAAGLDDATAGTIRIGERDVTRVPPVERDVAMVFQSYALFPHLTARQNIGFGLAARRTPRRELAERVAEAARLAGCEAFLERKPFQLSGGERQRVALARAVARHPALFLLDEPLSNLDAQLRTQTRAELKQLHQRLGRTMVYVTHDQIEALTLGDRVAVLDRGELQQLGTPDDIYRRPRNRFVAGFVGSPAMNFLPVTVDHGSLRAGPFRAEIERRTGPGRALEAGVRPEHVRLAAEGGVAADVQVVEVAGNEVYLHLVAGGHPLVVRTAADVRPSPGDRVAVAVAAEHVLLFDIETGEAVRD